MIIFPALAVAAIVFVFIMFAYHAGVEDIEKMGRNYKETREMKKVALIIIGLWLLLAGGVWATEKDCSQEVKIEVGGRYLIEAEKYSSNLVLSTYTAPSQQQYVTSIKVEEVSNSGKYALVHRMNEEKPSWVVIKDLKIIERLPEGGWKASSAELGSNTLEFKPTPGPWQDMKGR